MTNKLQVGDVIQVNGTLTSVTAIYGNFIVDSAQNLVRFENIKVYKTLKDMNIDLARKNDIVGF